MKISQVKVIVLAINIESVEHELNQKQCLISLFKAKFTSLKGIC